jgi:hypothetical protein
MDEPVTLTQSPTPTKTSNKSNLLFYIIIVVLVLVLLPSLFLNVADLKKIFGKKTSENAALVKNSLFSYQTATINGKITKVQDRTLTVQNTKGVTGDVIASQNISIMSQGDNNPISTPSADLKKIELNKDASLTLTAVGEQYEVTVISYVQSIPDPGNDTPIPSSQPQAEQSTPPIPSAPPQPSNSPVPIPSSSPQPLQSLAPIPSP